MKSSKVKPLNDKTQLITTSQNDVFETEVNLMTPAPDKGDDRYEHHRVNS